MPVVSWSGFLALIFFFLILDLGVFNKNPHRISAREALGWTAVWIVLSLLFSVAIYFGYENHFEGLGVQSGLDGKTAAIEYLTAYIIETGEFVSVRAKRVYDER